MNERRSINTCIWTDEWFEELNPHEKLIWLYLLTNPKANLIGIYEISIKRISFDNGLAKEEVKQITHKFQEEGKAFFTNGSFENFIKAFAAAILTLTLASLCSVCTRIDKTLSSACECSSSKLTALSL